MNDITKIEKDLLEYWVRHPRATDSVAGIVRWWLPGAEADEVATVLDWLVEQGMVERICHSSGECSYRRVHPRTG